MSETDKCIVHNCENRREDGHFIGPLCSPHHHMITSGEMMLQMAINTLCRHGVECNLKRFRDVKAGERFEWLVKRDHGPGECVKLTFSGTDYWCYTDFRTAHLYTDSGGGSYCVMKP